MGPYQHQPLDDGSIRLLQLLPDPDPDNPAKPIRSRLSHHALFGSSSIHSFEALSYAWGSSQTTHSILIDDCQYAITASLHVALLNLRDRFVERYLWIDAICIDQGNNSEKGYQVQNMARIYAQATRVIVWLGEATVDGSSDRALEIIRLITTTAAARGRAGADAKQVIDSLLRRPWFERVWVLQEVAAARQVLVKCGRAELDGYVFGLGLEKIRSVYVEDIHLLRLVRSTCELIMNAIFRPR